MSRRSLLCGIQEAATEEFFRFANLLPEAVLLVSGNGLIWAANKGVEKRLGLVPSSLGGQRLADLVADPPDRLGEYLRACSRTRDMLPGSLILSNQHGSSVACRSEGCLFQPKAEGSPALLLLRLVPKVSIATPFLVLTQKMDALSKEILRRRQVEQSLAEQKEWFRTTLASIGDAVITADTEGRVTFLNAVAQGLTGWTQGEAAGQPLTEVFRLLNEQTRQPVENPFERVLGEGVVVARDGTETPIEDSAAPIRDGAGHITGVVLVFHDVTKRRRAETDLRESEERFRTLADHISQLAWMADGNGLVFWYNRRWYEYTGTTLEEMEGWGWKKVHHPDHVQRVVERVQHSWDTGELWEDTFPLRGVDGTYRWFLSRAVPVRDGEGRVLRWFGTNTDITEQRELEQALKEAHRRKDEFLATLAHELRNPLAPIRNSLEVLRLAGNHPALREQAQSMMERQLGHLVRLIDDLLDVSRISRGKLELRKESVDLGAVVWNAVETARPLIEAEGHELTVTLPPEPVLLDADLTRLTQVITNLLNNAAKYTNRGGQIWLTAERQGSKAVVRVRDTGMGIPTDQLSHIFEMFVQVDQSLEKSKSGLGIGLTLVKRLTEMHGGKVEAKSEGPGKGSEFVVRLPVVTMPGKESQQPGSEEPSTLVARKKILVVDDNEDAAASLGLILQMLGHEVRTATDGLEGVQVAAAFQPDLAFVDLGMPRLNGYDACRRIREQAGKKKMFLVALSGWGQEEDRCRTKEAGFDEHLVKPLDPDKLEKLLAAV